MEAPLANGFLAVGSVVVGTDFAKTGRPLSKVGLEGMSRDEVLDFLSQGYAK
ncbi:hypothetical protein D3C87_2073030 [compost metagenome]